MNLYKIYINTIPFCRAVLKATAYRLFRHGIHIGPKSRIKSNTEWKLFPGCEFKAGNGLIVGKGVTLSVAKNATIIIGKNVGIGNRCQIVCHKHIKIGEGTVIAPNVMLFDHNHVFDLRNGVHQRDFTDGEIVIGRHCWLGAGCIVLKDVHIGDNCVIGAGSVVTKDIDFGSIAVGSPAKVIRKIE